MRADKPSWKTPLLAMKLAAIVLIGILLVGIYIKTERNGKTGFSPRDAYDSSRLTFYKKTNNKEIDLTVFNLPKSEFILLSFWASWCSTCKPELKELDEFLKKLENQKPLVSNSPEYKSPTKNFKAFSVNLNPLNEQRKVLKLWGDLKLNMELILGSEKKITNENLRNLDIEVLPTYLLIKDNKEILLKIDGATKWSLLKNQKIIKDQIN